MVWATAIILILAIFMLVMSLRAFCKLRWWRGMRRLILCGVLLGLSLLSFSILSITYTFTALSSEQNLALVRIQAIAPQDYLVTITPNDGMAKTYSLRGDQWLLSGQVLVWKNFAQLMGFHSRVRLYRLEGIYNNILQEQTARHAVYDLSQMTRPDWLPQWPLTHLGAWLIRTIYGSAVYMPLADGTQYQINLTQTGLIAIKKTPS